MSERKDGGETDMAETPERIWVREVPVKVVCHGEYDLTDENGGTPYVTASLLDEAVEALEGICDSLDAIDAEADRVAESGGKGWSSAPVVKSLYARRDARATLAKIRSKT